MIYRFEDSSLRCPPTACAATWYDQQLNASAGAYVEPQDLQAKFPRFQDLSIDLMNVNQNLVAYRAAMRRIVYDD